MTWTSRGPSTTAELLVMLATCSWLLVDDPGEIRTRNLKVGVPYSNHWTTYTQQKTRSAGTPQTSSNSAAPGEWKQLNSVYMMTDRPVLPIRWQELHQWYGRPPGHYKRTTVERPSSFICLLEVVESTSCVVTDSYRCCLALLKVIASLRRAFSGASRSVH